MKYTLQLVHEYVPTQSTLGSTEPKSEKKLKFRRTRNTKVLRPSSKFQIPKMNIRFSFFMNYGTPEQVDHLWRKLLLGILGFSSLLKIFVLLNTYCRFSEAILVAQ